MAGVWSCASLCLLFLHTGTVPHGMLDLHVQEQTLVQFEIPKQHGKFLILDWIYNTRHVVVSYNHKHNDIVKKPWDNAEFNKETFSLTLKRVQKNQSGEYMAKIHTSSTNQIVAHYRILVQAAVEAPVLIGPSNQSSSDCNVTVTCRGHDLSLKLNCNSTSCFPQIVTVLAASSLTMFVKNGFVVCNHSNHVSWKNITKKIDFRCRTTEDNMELNHIFWKLAIGTAFLFLVIIMCVILWGVNHGFASTKSEITEAGNDKMKHLDADSKGSPKPSWQNTYVPLRQRLRASLKRSDRDSSNCTAELKTTRCRPEDNSTALPVPDHDDGSERESTHTALRPQDCKSDHSDEVYMNIGTDTNIASSASLEGHEAKTDFEEDSDDGIYVNSREIERICGCVGTEADYIYGASGSNVESEDIYASCL